MSKQYDWQNLSIQPDPPEFYTDSEEELDEEQDDYDKHCEKLDNYREY